MENLSVPAPLVSSFPSAPAPLRGGGVEAEVSSVVPFIVVVGRPWTVGNFNWHTEIKFEKRDDSTKADMFGAFRPTAAVNVGLLWCVYVCISCLCLKFAIIGRCHGGCL